MTKKVERYKVIVNYPTTPEGIEEYNESYARGVFNALRKIISDEQLVEFMEMLKEKSKKEE